MTARTRATAARGSVIRKTDPHHQRSRKTPESSGPSEAIAPPVPDHKAIAFVMKNGEIVDESKLPLAGGKQHARFTAPR